jgi:hypothetical protein
MGFGRDLRAFDRDLGANRAANVTDPVVLQTGGPSGAQVQVKGIAHEYVS